ncbi:oligosaccharide flippase family protein [Oxalobacteraceae bacterium]|nr:oligosaccharide flippase family protein [Oxalobacteraceae bacterium]
MAAAATASKARLSFVFSFAEKYLLLLLGSVNAMVLARLLRPDEIGVYAIGAVLVALAQVLRDLGVSQYLIQQAELDRTQLRAALGLSMAAAWALALLVLALSAPMAGFYGDARLQVVLQLLALNFVLLPFGAVTLPYLRRQLRFSAIFKINIAHGLGQMLCSLALALAGFGYLSLVWGTLAGTAAGLLATLCWRPRELPWWPGLRGMRQMLRFGAWSTGGGLVDELGVAAPDLIVGKLIGVAEVGLFGKAAGMLSLFNQAITSAVSPVLFPLYAALARDGCDLRAAYLKTASYMTALAWPFFVFVWICAPQLLRLLYGPQWDAALPLIRIMCISSAAYSMFSMARYLFVATGQVAAQARLDAQAVALRILALLLAAPFGLVWVAWAVVLGAIFRCWLTYRCLRRLTGLQAGALLAAVLRSAVLAALCALAPLAVLAALPGALAQPLLPLLAAALAALGLWLLGIGLLKHEVAAEFAFLRQQMARLLAK